MFVANLRAEWTKLRSVRSTVWTLLATVGLAVGFGALIGASQMSSWDNLDPAERLRFDPTSFSLSGLFLAQLAVGVLGVLIVSSEYATGQIRATLGATPQRLTVLAAKATTFIGVVLATGIVASAAPSGSASAIFAAKGLDASIADPGVLRAVIGGALYLTGIGLLGVGVGAIVRRTAGAVAALVALLFIVPIVTGFLPSSFQETIGKYLPAQAGMAIFNVVPDPRALSPWTGFGVLLAYGAAALTIGGVAPRPPRRLKGPRSCEAITCTGYGRPTDVLRPRDIDEPTLAPDHVLVEVHAASLNSRRLAPHPRHPRISPACRSGSAARASRSPAATSPESSRRSDPPSPAVRPGDEVYGTTFMAGFGAFAEKVTVPERLLARRPRNMSFAEAAAVPLAASTALQACATTAGPELGHTC